MPKKKYKITNAGTSPDSPILVDCHIEETDNGYELVAKRVVLASITSTQPPFTFPSFNYDGETDWQVTVSTIANNAMDGSWSNSDANPTGEEDSWTATGSGSGEPEEDESRSASA